MSTINCGKSFVYLGKVTSLGEVLNFVIVIKDEGGGGGVGDVCQKVLMFECGVLQ